MPLERQVKIVGLSLTSAEARRVDHCLDAIERRLAHHADPQAFLVISRQGRARRIEVDLRIQVSPLGLHLVSRQDAVTPGVAVHLAAREIERQIERKHAQQRGEPTYAVPSRRLPASARPSPLAASPAAREIARDDGEPSTLPDPALFGRSGLRS